MMWTAASMASSLAPAKRVENRCVRISKRDASEGSEDNAGGGEGGADADCGRCAAADAGLRPLRPKASMNITPANNAVTTPTEASAANGP